MRDTGLIIWLFIFLFGISIGLLIGLRQQHVQKDYMIKILMQNGNNNNNQVQAVSLPKITDMK